MYCFKKKETAKNCPCYTDKIRHNQQKEKKAKYCSLPNLIYVAYVSAHFCYLQ